MKGKIKYIVAYYIILSAFLICSLILGHSDEWGTFAGGKCHEITYRFWGMILYVSNYYEKYGSLGQPLAYEEYNTFFILILAVIILIAYLVPIIIILVRRIVKEKISDKSQVEYQNIEMTKFVLLLIFTFGIYYYCWIYKTTKVLNEISENEKRNPTNKLLLCIFCPFYSIYWVYKSCNYIDRYVKKTISENEESISVLCTVLAVFIPIVAPIIMQRQINIIFRRM